MLVALVGIPVVVAALWYGDAALATLLAVVSAIGAAEVYRLSRQAGLAPLAMIGVPLAGALPVLVHAVFLGVLRVTPVMFVLAMLVLLVVTLFSRGPGARPLEDVAVTVFGVLYVAGTMSFAYALRYHGYAIGARAGMAVALFPIVLTWASDTGAYFAGRLFKGPKLMPTVSPAKTISGAIGGLVLTVIASFVLVPTMLRPLAQLAFTPVGMVVFGVAVSIAAQCGDLVESLFKRAAGVKDSGSVFPGHGGVLDRLDSLFFVLPLSYLLYGLLLIPAPR